jgi:hypothetical protein
MSQRFISNLALGIAGAVVVVSSQAFMPATTGWVAFGVSLGALALLAVMQRDRSRGGQRLLDAEIALLAVWTAVASVVYAGATLKWLSLGEGIVFAALAVAGLTIHELRTERVVHALQAVPVDSAEEEELQAAA